MKKTTLAVLCLLSCLWASAVRADDRDTAVGLVQKAVAFYQANGAEKLLEEVNKRDGQFVNGAFYVAVEDLEGTMLAHPMNARLVGQPMNGLKDPDGKFFNKEIQAVAKSPGKGWVDYKYLNPKTGEIENKSSYVERADELVVLCGIYRK